MSAPRLKRRRQKTVLDRKGLVQHVEPPETLCRSKLRIDALDGPSYACPFFLCAVAGVAGFLVAGVAGVIFVPVSLSSAP